MIIFATYEIGKNLNTMTKSEDILSLFSLEFFQWGTRHMYQVSLSPLYHPRGDVGDVLGDDESSKPPTLNIISFVVKAGVCSNIFFMKELIFYSFCNQSFSLSFFIPSTFPNIQNDNMFIFLI